MSYPSIYDDHDRNPISGGTGHKLPADFTADQIIDLMVDTIDYERAVTLAVIAGRLDHNVADRRIKDRFMLSGLSGAQLEGVVAFLLSWKSNRLNPNPGG